MSEAKYTDIISYELAEGIDEAHLLEVAQEVVQGWMKNLPGFISWEIHKNASGSYFDIVRWESAEAAKHAEMEMNKIPNGAEWFQCYKEGSISAKNLHRVALF